jgi:hypothetical protein
MSEISGFFDAIRDDNRIGPTHISLFMAIVYYWVKNDCKNPVCIFSRDLMQLAKISGLSTYYKSVGQLNNYKYIRYEPSKNHFSGSLFYIKSNSILNKEKRNYNA